MCQSIFNVPKNLEHFDKPAQLQYSQSLHYTYQTQIVIYVSSSAPTLGIAGLSKKARNEVSIRVPECDLNKNYELSDKHENVCRGTADDAKQQPKQNFASVPE